MKIIYVYLFIQQHPIFGNHMFSERLFDQWWPPGLNENILTFNITFHMLNQKDQEENGKEEVNLYKIGVCKFGEEDGCVYQDKDDKMVMTVIFLVLEWIPKKGISSKEYPLLEVGMEEGASLDCHYYHSTPPFCLRFGSSSLICPIRFNMQYTVFGAMVDLIWPPYGSILLELAEGARRRPPPH